MIMPNDQTVTTDWGKHRCSIDDIEELTGYTFFPDIQKNVAAIIKKRPSGRLWSCRRCRLPSRPVDDEPIKAKAKKGGKKKKASGEDE